MTRFLAGTLVGAMAVVGTPTYGTMPNHMANWANVAVGHKVAYNYGLSGVFGQVEHEAMPNGGPQGVEGYVYDDHPDGMTRLTIGTIGNVEIGGRGRTLEVRGMQSGGLVSGDGTVDRWIGLNLSRPAEKAAGQVTTYIPIQFSNGASLVELGDQIFFCPPHGLSCHSL